MKILHYRRENYPIKFEYRKPDEYFDGELLRKSWLFEVCDWCGTTIEGFYDENEMLEYIDNLDDEELEEIQIFAYPLLDDEHYYDGPYGRNIGGYGTKVKEKYVFPIW